jgi:hypothetical protein
MVGQGVLRECLLDADVTDVLAVGRLATGIQHTKLKDFLHSDLLNYTPVESQFLGYDACFFCLGATAAGRTEAQYTAINQAIPLAVGTMLAQINPGMAFIYVSGAGTDSSERGRIMWARVKGRTENELLRLKLNAFMFRPAFIQPMHGETSKTLAYRVLIATFTPLFPLLRAFFPGFATTTERIGRAMLRIAKNGYREHVLECRAINELG